MSLVMMAARRLRGLAAVGGAAPTLTLLSRDTVSTAGGAALTLTGTNFVSGASVSVGGTAATSVVVVSSTTITCVTPAKAANSGYDVTVTTSGGTSSALPLEVLAAPTTTYDSLLADDGITQTSPTRLGNFVCEGSANPVYSTEQALPGQTHSVKCAQTGNGSSYLHNYLGVNPAALSTGVYLRAFMYVTQAYADNVYTSQGKLSTYRRLTGGGSTGYVVLGIGAEIGNAYNRIATIQDDGGTYLDPMVYAALNPGTWQEVQIWMKRTGTGTGVMRAWCMGKKQNEQTALTFSVDNSSSDNYTWEIGMIVNQNVVNGAVENVMYLDKLAIANGFVD